MTHKKALQQGRSMARAILLEAEYLKEQTYNISRYPALKARCQYCGTKEVESRCENCGANATPRREGSSRCDGVTILSSQTYSSNW